MHYLERFARTATRVYAHVEAAVALSDALGLVERLPPAERDRRRAELALRLARSLTVQGRFGEIVELLAGNDAGIARLDDPSLAGHHHFLRGNAHSLLGEGAEATRAVQRALVEASRAGDSLTVGRAPYVLALEGFWSGELLDGEAARAIRADAEADRHRAAALDVFRALDVSRWIERASALEDDEAAFSARRRRRAPSR